jgi:threonine dehydrogenase-like Zn-dependent dehydrogenase
MLTLEVSSAFMAHELQIVGAYASGIDDLAAVIDLARGGQLDAGSWVSHRMGLSEFDAALEVAETRPPGTIRVVVEPERG